MSCLVVAGSDPITRSTRRGAALRLSHPPAGVRYVVKRDAVVAPRSLGHYALSPVGASMAVLAFAAEHLLPFDQSGYSLIHSFYWNAHRYRKPWIHENDQSPGQFLSGYAGTEGFVKRRFMEFFASYLNSGLCRGVVVWSEWAKRGYVEEGVDAGKVSVIPPPVPLREERVAHRGVNLLFIGRDYARKGGDMALRVFWRLSRQFRDLRLTYVGRVDDGGVARRIREDGRIRHLASPPDRLLYGEILPSSDVMILPTRADAFAISLAEAMAYGMPVVASDVGAIPEIVADGVTGFLARRDDVEGFVSLSSKVVEDESLRRKMSAAAEARARKLFSPEALGKKLLRVYQDALKA